MILFTDYERNNGRIVSGKIKNEFITIDFLFRKTFLNKTP